MMTFGIPGRVAPATERPGASRRARYQTEGVRRPRCGSLARIGRPDFVREPARTQELLPTVSAPNPSSSRSSKRFLRAIHEAGDGRREAGSGAVFWKSPFHSSSRRIVGSEGTGGNSSAARRAPTASTKRARRISLAAFTDARSQAIILAHTRQSAALNGSGENRKRRNSIGREPDVARKWFTPAT